MGTSSDTAAVRSSSAVWADRHHWLNTLLGLLDQAFQLTDDEQFFVLDILSRLLDALHIPYRSVPAQLPAAVAVETEAGVYAQQLASSGSGLVPRPVRAADGQDLVVSVAAWRNALLGMLVCAYPDLDEVERLASAQVLDDLLLAVGVPRRRALYLPGEVIAAHRDVDLLH